MTRTNTCVSKWRSQLLTRLSKTGPIFPYLGVKRVHEALNHRLINAGALGNVNSDLGAALRCVHDDRRTSLSD